MPTEAHADILYRDLAVVQVRDVYPDTSPLLIEVVNFGTNALVRAMSYGEGEENLHLAAFALYRHILENTDAIQVLVENGCPATAAPNLRTSFEALLSLEYITESDDEYRIRSLSWLAGYARKRLRVYRSLLTSTQLGRDFLRSIEEDKTVRDFPSLPQDQVAEGVERMESLLARDQFIEIQKEFASFDREPRWFRLFDGPHNVRELARHLERSAQYDVLYRQWSSVVHGEDFSPFIARGPRGEMGVRGLRDLTKTNEVTTFATTFMLDAIRHILKKFHPGETWGNWYLREVQERYLNASRSIRQ